MNGESCYGGNVMDIKKINKIVKTDIKEGLKETYPEVFEDNKINFEKLKALLNGEIIEKEDDRFYFNWAGKSSIYKIIQAPAYGTLKPDKEKSVDFDRTENIVIVGENLETLKLLLKPYFGKVKMIYIDPPYNTGKDFIYRDNFKEPLKDYLEKTGQIDSEGKKLTTNTEASGRYHSDWLNFIYPRLFLARSLLRDDGVIFISIDDNEVHNLRKIMDEIFGEENFVAIFPCRKRTAKSDVPFRVSQDYEWLLCFAKSNLFSACIKGNTRKYYESPDLPGRAWRIHEMTTHRTATERPNSNFTIIDPKTGKKYPVNPNAVWRVTKESFKKFYKENRIVFPGDYDFLNISKPVLRYFKDEDEAKTGGELGFVTVSTNLPKEVGMTQDGTKDIDSLFDRKIFGFPKPMSLIKYLIKITTSLDKTALILDFFAGSGTTGHAVWDLNKGDGGNRKFILVQLDEKVLDEEIKKEFPAVADICIERLRRVAEKYKKEIALASPRNDKNGGGQDFGFKVFRLDKSNFNLKDEFEIEKGQDAEELKKKYLEWLGMFVDQPLVSGWKKIDVIYEVLLKEGLNLNSQIERVRIKNNHCYYVKDTEQNLEFYICLEDKIENETIEEIRTSKYKGKTFVFLDKALTDNDKINLSAFVRLKVI